jgi:hypothetical protein
MSGDFFMEQWIAPVGRPYSDFVWRAATSSEAFATFRSEPTYTRIVETVGPMLASQCLSLVKDNRAAMAVLTGSAYADTVGSPATMPVEGQQIAPTTVRYAMIAADLLKHFPDIHTFKHIAEIGVGYGGQARIIGEILRGASLETITLIDMYEVLLLSRRYLEHFSLQPVIAYKTKSELAPCDYDLAISNYSFSEFTRDLQQEYLDKVLLRARCGFMIMNTLQKKEQFSQGELVSRLPNARIFPESPPGSGRTYILVFGSTA